MTMLLANRVMALRIGRTTLSMSWQGSAVEVFTMLMRVMSSIASSASLKLPKDQAFVGAGCVKSGSPAAAKAASCWAYFPFWDKEGALQGKERVVAAQRVAKNSGSPGQTQQEQPSSSSLMSRQRAVSSRSRAKIPEACKAELAIRRERQLRHRHRPLFWQTASTRNGDLLLKRVQRWWVGQRLTAGRHHGFAGCQLAKPWRSSCGSRTRGGWISSLRLSSDQSPR